MTVLRSVSLRARHVWRRNLDVFLRTWWTNFPPPLLEPLLYLVAFGGGMGALVGSVVWDGRSVSYAAFLGPGIIAVGVMFWAVFETLYASFVRMYYQKTFDAIIATPLSLEDVIVGEILWGATKSVIVATLTLAVIALLGLVQLPAALLALPFAFLAGLLFASLGMCITAVCPTIDAFNLPVFAVIFPMFLFSGTFFPVEILPPWARALAALLPLTHVSMFVRSVCLGETGPHLWRTVGYTALLATALFWLSLSLMRRRLIR